MTTFVSSRHPLPGSSGSTRVWLRWPYLAVCDGALVQVFSAAAGAEGGSSAGNAAEGAPLQCLRRFSLARYNTGAAASGRGANVLHGLDVRAGCLVGGTASGLVLHVELGAGAGSAARRAPLAEAACRNERGDLPGPPLLMESDAGYYGSSAGRCGRGRVNAPERLRAIRLILLGELSPHLSLICQSVF